MNYVYKISPAFIIADRTVLILAVFPSWNGEPERIEDGIIYVTFDTTQTPADLGPLVKVELLTP